MADGFLARWRGRRTLAAGPPAEIFADPLVAAALPLWMTGKALPQPHDFATFAEQGYRRSSLIYACIREIARTAAEPRMIAVKPGAKPLDEIQGHPAVALWERPSPDCSGFELLERMATYLYVAGNAYVHKVRSKGGDLVELYLLRPDRVRIVPGPKGEVAYYEYGVSDENKLKVPAGDVIHIRFPDPADDYYGLAPVHVASRHSDLDEHATDYLRAFFLNGGAPSGLLSFKTGRATPAERERVRAMWREQYGGIRGWHNVGVIDADVDFRDVGSRPENLRLDAVFDQSETRVCSIFGVPPIVIGTRFGLMRSTYSNYEQAVRSFWQETIKPLYARIGETLTRGLVPEFGSGGGFEMMLDTSQVEALQESSDTLRKWAREGWVEGLLTRNEARELVGLDALPGDLGKVFRQAAAWKPVPFDKDPEEFEDVVPPGPPGTGGAPSPPGAPRPPGTGEPEEEGRGRAREPASRPLRVVAAKGEEPSWRAFHRAADAQVPALRRAVEEGLLLAREAVPVRALEDACARSDVEAVARIVETALSSQLRPDALEPPILRAMVAGAAVGERALPSEPEQHAAAPTVVGRFDTRSPEMISAASRQTAALVREVTEHQRFQIRQIVARGFDEGRTIEQMAKSLRSVVGLTARQAGAVLGIRQAALAKGLGVDEAEKLSERAYGRALKRRSLTIARTETIRAAALGQHEVWNAGVETGLISAGSQRRSITTPDDRTCPICAPMNGQLTTDLHGPFHKPNGFAVTMPPIHPNCRCAVSLVPKAPSEAATPPAPPVVEPVPVPPLRPATGVPTSAFADKWRVQIGKKMTQADVDALDASMRAVPEAWRKAVFETPADGFSRFTLHYCRTVSEIEGKKFSNAIGVCNYADRRIVLTPKFGPAPTEALRAEFAANTAIHETGHALDWVLRPDVRTSGRLHQQGKFLETLNEEFQAAAMTPKELQYWQYWIGDNGRNGKIRGTRSQISGTPVRLQTGFEPWAESTAQAGGSYEPGAHYPGHYDDVRSWGEIFPRASAEARRMIDEAIETYRDRAAPPVVKP